MKAQAFKHFLTIGSKHGRASVIVNEVIKTG